MKLFSKRHSERRIGFDNINYQRNARLNQLLSSEARNRLIAEIKFLSTRNDFLEFYVLFEDKRITPSIIYFDEDKINDFSLSELGYRMTDNFDFKNFEMKQSRQLLKYASDGDSYELYYDDYRLFDLAEITILFSKSKERQNTISRINNILVEENTNFVIIESLITRKHGDDLRGIMGILKDETLRQKLERFFDYYSKRDFVNSAKISADIINIIFSDKKDNGKLALIENVKQKVSTKLINEPDADKRDRMSSYINDSLKLSRNLSNDIYDVRHTEKSTLHPIGDNVYEFVSRQNLNIISITITALKDDFVLSDDWETIKAAYNEKYKIDTHSRSIYKPVISDGIDLSEIPF